MEESLLRPFHPRRLFPFCWVHAVFAGPGSRRSKRRVDQWLKLFESPNAVVRHRAAAAILRHGGTAPLPVLLEILDDLHDHGLGAEAERVLVQRRDPALLPEMVARLASPSAFVREVACWVLREFRDRSTTPHLLAMLGDKCFGVRKAAVCALQALADPEAGPALLRHYQSRREEINVRVALESALNALNISYERYPD